jgi:mycothiol synthase
MVLDEHKSKMGEHWEFRMPVQTNSKPTLPEGFVVRGATMDDLEAIVDLWNDYWEPLVGVRKINIDDAHALMTMPGFDMCSSTRTVWSPGRKLVGCIIVRDLSSPPVHPDVLGCVYPSFEGQGIGTYLVTWAEERAREAIARVPDGVRVAMHLTTSPEHQPTTRLFEKLGIHAIRYSWFMVADLATAPPEPIWPENIVLSTYKDQPDLRAVFRVIDDAFRDHWGYVDRPEEERFERFQYQLEHDKDFDPSLWFLAMDGDEIAGLAGCSPKTGDDVEMGFVNVLGVRRPWRRRGLGLALLQHAFGEFRRRGKSRVGLGVDADSLTGATRLYQKAGMQVARQLVTYEKELRPGKELGTQSIKNQLGNEAVEKINLGQRFALFDEFWAPKIVGELNGQYIKLAKLKGEFVWHHHEAEDELFLVVKGRLIIKLLGRDIVLEENELCIIPRGVEHKPLAEEETQILLFEPVSTRNTGNVRTEQTIDRQERI